MPKKVYYTGSMHHFTIHGGKKLCGTITVNGSKNAAVALLAASVMNRGTTTFKNMPRIEEVNRWVEILESIGMKITRRGDTMTLVAPERFCVDRMNAAAAVKTRSAILLIAALAGRASRYVIPQAGGCKLGARTIAPHLYALEKHGLRVDVVKGGYDVTVAQLRPCARNVLYESGDTVTESALLAAAQTPGTTVISMASANYMVQDLCFFLEALGVRIDGIGTSTLTVHGIKTPCADVTYTISEDPIEAMFFVSLAIVTKSELTITRVPMDFMELELLKLEKMGQRYVVEREYLAENHKTRLADVRVIPSKLTALEDKIHPMPFPGINMDNLPFFVPIAMTAKGTTLIHDWVFENRAVYYTELNRLGGNITLIDSHRVTVEGPTAFRNADLTSPPALRPAAIMLVAMLAAKGTSVLRDVYAINRGYENLQDRLRAIGADITLGEEQQPKE